VNRITRKQTATCLEARNKESCSEDMKFMPKFSCISIIQLGAARPSLEGIVCFKQPTLLKDQRSALPQVVIKNGIQLRHRKFYFNWHDNRQAQQYQQLNYETKRRISLSLVTPYKGN